MDRRSFLSSLLATLAASKGDFPAAAAPKTLRLDFDQVPFPGIRYAVTGCQISIGSPPGAPQCARKPYLYE